MRLQRALAFINEVVPDVWRVSSFDLGKTNSSEYPW